MSYKRSLRRLRGGKGQKRCRSAKDPRFEEPVLTLSVNYEAREQANQTYTSQVAESHIESIINAWHKKSGKMQWTREVAHNVLQIRGLIASNEWGDSWLSPVLSALGVAA